MGSKKDKIIESFKKVVQRNYSPSKIILFGSRATGKAKKNSDYDFVVVSPKFKSLEWEERGARIYYLKRNIPASMDIICLTPEEFEKKKHQFGVIREAVREGIEI